jgi:hypothetical protein
MADQNQTAKKAAAKKAASRPADNEAATKQAPDAQGAADSGAPQRKQGEEQPIDVVVVQGNTHVFEDVEDVEAYTPPKETK